MNSQGSWKYSKYSHGGFLSKYMVVFAVVYQDCGLHSRAGFIDFGMIFCKGYNRGWHVFEGRFWL